MARCPSCGREVPSADFAFCPWCTAPLTDQSAGQRKTVTLLFCDLVDSTDLGSRVDPEVLRGVLEAYWSSARSVVAAHGGTVEKFIGDAVVGVFGLPVLHEDDALRGVRAAADLLAAVRELNKDLTTRLDIELAVRIGVNTGEVLAGTGGVTLMSGDAANVAARLQSSAAPGQVLLGETTHELVRDAVDVEPVGPLTVKGKSIPLVAYQLLGVRPASVGQIRRRRFSVPMVGRSRQLALGEAMYGTAVEEQSCVLLTIVGEPGVGKSRLVDELAARIGDEALVLTGRCLPYGDGITYAPVVEMLLRLHEQDPRPIREILDGVGHADQVVDGLEILAGEARTATAPELAWAFRRLIETLSLDRPVVLVVDDLQWAKPGLLDLLDHVSDMSRGAPILVVGMARPEFLSTRSGWGAGRSNSTTISLPALTSASTEQLATELLGPGFDAGLRSRIIAAAEGIPLYVEETVAMLVDEGRLVPDGSGGWVADGDLTQVSVPATIRALLAARLDQLVPPLREVVDAASVVGKTFYPEAVSRLLQDAPDVSERIDALIRSDLITPTDTDLARHEAFGFNHLLTAEAAYLALPKRRRASLHVLAARWFQEQSSDATMGALVAFHLGQAVSYQQELGEGEPDLTDEATRLLLAMVDRSTALGDASAAVGYAGRAVDTAPSISSLAVQARLARSRAARLAGDVPGAFSWAKQAEGAADSLGDPGLAWRARIHRSYLQVVGDPGNRVTDTLELCEQAIGELAELEDHAALADAYRLRAAAHHQLGRAQAASADALSAFAEARQAPPEARRYADLLSPICVGALEHGEASIEEGQRLLDQLDDWLGDDPVMRHDIAAERIWVTAYLGDLAEAEAQLRDRINLFLAQGSTLWAASWLAFGVGWCQEWSGDLRSTVDSLRTAERWEEIAGETGNRSTVLVKLALALATLGETEEAEQALATSRSIGQDLDLINDIYEAGAEGILLARQGEDAASEARFESGLRVVAGSEFYVPGAELWLARSTAREIVYDRDGAIAAARQALLMFEHKGFVAPIALVRARLTQLGALE